MGQTVFNMAVFIACAANVVLMAINMHLEIVTRFHLLYELLFLCFFSSLAIMTATGIEYLPATDKKWALKLIGLPLYPLILLAQLSNNKTLSKISFPLSIIIVMLPLVTFSCDFICTLFVAESPRALIVPYLNLTIILLLFSYCEKNMMSYLLSMPVANEIPTKNKHFFAIINNDRLFLKISFWFLAIFSTISSIEKFSGTSILQLNSNYRAIFFESLLTLVAFDRAFDKSQSKKERT